MHGMIYREKIFEISSEREFLVLALEAFAYQYKHNEVYREYVDARNIRIDAVTQLEHIPFLPIDFFKTHDVVCGNVPP